MFIFEKSNVSSRENECFLEKINFSSRKNKFISVKFCKSRKVCLRRECVKDKRNNLQFHEKSRKILTPCFPSSSTFHPFYQQSYSTVPTPSASHNRVWFKTIVIFTPLSQSRMLNEYDVLALYSYRIYGRAVISECFFQLPVRSLHSWRCFQEVFRDTDCNKTEWVYGNSSGNGSMTTWMLFSSRSIILWDSIFSRCNLENKNDDAMLRKKFHDAIS